MSAVIVELLRDDGTVAAIAQLRDGVSEQRVTFPTGIIGRFTHGRVWIGGATALVTLIGPIVGGAGVTTSVQFDFLETPVPPLYTNPAWRWWHAENHELGLITINDRPANIGNHTHVMCARCHVDIRPEWYGLPRPVVRSLAGHRLNERFAHLRDHAWLRAIDHVEGVSRTLAEVQADMPDWPHLFAFHAFTAVWLTLDEDDQVVLLDAWEAANIGGDCAGRVCEGAA